MTDRYALLATAYTSFWRGVDWVFPPECAGCGAEGYQICPDCLQGIHYTSRESCVYCGRKLKARGICPRCLQNLPAYAGVRCVAGFEGVIRQVVINLKYHADLGLSLAAAELMARLVQEEAWRPEMVVPVPLSVNRRRKRGYNQAAVLAFPLSLYLKLPMRTQALARIRDTRSQVGLNSQERQDNVRGAFKADPRLVRGKEILLVDDVFTTGATLRAAAEALRSAGCAKVQVVTLAKALNSQ